METTLGSARILFLAIAGIGILALLAIFLMRKRALSPDEKTRWSGTRHAPLDSEELTRLARWQRRMRVVATATLFYAGAMVGFASALPEDAWLPRWIAFMILPAMILAGLALQFSVRCPRCAMQLGLQSSLGVPASCERCGVSLHK